MNIRNKQWTKKNHPKRILAIRLQAMGDLIITLPYLQSLKNNLPSSSSIDLLTREEVDSVPRAINLFTNTFSIGGGRSFKKQLWYTLLLMPRIICNRYDAVLDLQNNIISRGVRKLIHPKAWSEFDKISPFPAGERTRLTIEAAGFPNIQIASNFQIKSQAIGALLKQEGWDGSSDLIILNPAGFFPSRNWPLDYYIKFARLWLEKFPTSQFLVIGINQISEKAAYLKSILGKKIISLVNKTTPAEAFAILQKVKLVLSEDSGLMHMAWVSSIPTLAIFGSTRSDWATPLGKHTHLLHSSDLPCGNCMLEQCKFGDTHCITRYSPEFVFNIALSLI